MTDDERRAQAQAESVLATIEITSAMADVASAMKNALEDRGFSSPVAEPAAVQFMFAVGASWQVTR